jgi:glycosyltransferase involved in cell wall biosynthesis
MKQPITVIITCFDDQQRLASCVDRCQGIADEILIAESVDQSGAQEIARQDDRIRVVPHEPIRRDDFLNWTISQATHGWVLLLDADEQINQALIDEIELVLSRGATHDAYVINRDTFVNGKRLEAPDTNSSRKVRLFRTDQVLCVQTGSTKTIEIQSGNVGKLSNKIRRSPDWRFDVAIKSLTTEAANDAQRWVEQGKQTSWLRMLVTPGYHFAVQYFWRGSIFDGVEGIRISWQTAFQRFCTHAFLLDLQQASHPQEVAQKVDPKTVDLLDPTFRRAA